MGGAKNCPETPRQKMISMMYLVLTAMLALNVSAQILNGYSLVDKSMRTNTGINDGKVENYKSQFNALLHSDSIKANRMKAKVDSVISESDALCDYIDELKLNIIKKVTQDPNATLDAVDDEGFNAGDLNIVHQVGLVEKVEGNKTNGQILKEHVERYREFLKNIDTTKTASIENNFSTADVEPLEKGGPKTPWEYSVFAEMPCIATLTVLDKIKNDVKVNQAEALAYLIGAMDADAFIVNKIQAIAIPKSSYVMKGSKYSAEIILAATDSTKKPVIYVGEKVLQNGNVYEVPCGAVGPQKYKGRMELTRKNGKVETYNFESEYIVGEPTATVSADLMNVLYAGFDNPVSVSVPGVAASQISISVTNCRNQTKTGKGWIIKPATVGTPCKISVSANIDGRNQPIATKEFRVKKLPDPLAMLEVNGANGGKELFKGGKAIAKSQLITARRIVAKLDDADLEVKYKVLEFTLSYFDSMGNTLLEKASGDQLTDRQLKVFKDMTKAKTVYITNTQAIGQDNLRRTLPPVEIKIK